MNDVEKSSDELEIYINQIKSYESQLEIINLEADEEEMLKKSRPEWVLVLWTGIAGIQHYVDISAKEGKQLLKRLKQGVELKLVRDADNEYDRWAIAVYTKQDEKLGYITRYKNETIARLMDRGYKFHAIVENHIKTDHRVPEEQRTVTENFVLPFSIWME